MSLSEHPAWGSSLLDVVDGSELADGGLGSIVGVVVHSDLAALDLFLDGLVLVLGEGLEVPAVVCGGQADVIAILQTEVAVGSSDLAPVTGLDVGQSGVDSLRQTLHGRGDERVVGIGAVSHAVCADVVLVNVHADDVAVVLQSSLHSGGVYDFMLSGLSFNIFILVISSFMFSVYTTLFPS